MLLVKAPIPVPSVVFDVSAIVGLELVFQQTPLTVMAAPPSVVIVPPDIAVVDAIDEAALVANVGNDVVATVISLE